MIFALLKSNVNALSTFKVGKAMMLGIKCVLACIPIISPGVSVSVGGLGGK